MKPLTSTDPVHIGPHRLLARLGAGAMGQVYLARTAQGRLAAVKAVRRELAEDTDFLIRFAREVRTAQRVRGPFTPAVLGADPDAPVPWMATEYVPGPTLSEAVRANGPFPEATLRVLVLGLAQALQAVHAAGLMHRDLKPGNILLSPRGPQVIDFGIARAVEGTVLTKTGQSFGTPSYTSPEQVLGQATSPASDVFSLAGVVVFAATGAPAFGRGRAAEVLTRVVSLEPALDEVPQSLRPLLTRCLAKEPTARPTADEIVRELSFAPLPANEQGWLPPSVHQEIDDHHRELDRVVTAPSVRSAPVERRRVLRATGAVAGTLLLLSGVGLAIARPWEPGPGPTADATPEASAEDDTDGDATTEDEEDEVARTALTGTFYGIHFSGDGESLYVNSSESITRWDWREAELIETVFSGAERPHSFDVGAEGTLAGAFEDEVRIWNAEHEEVATYTSRAPEDLDLFDSVSLSADGSLLAFRERDQDENVTVRVWDWSQDTVVWERRVDALRPVLAPDGSHLVLDHGSNLPRLEVLNLDTDTTVATFPRNEPGEGDPHPLYHFAFDPQSAHLGVSGSAEKTTVVLDLATGDVVHEFDSSGYPTGVAFTPDGSRLISGGGSGGIAPGGSMWDLESQEPLVSGTTVIYEQPTVHPEGETIAVVESGLEGFIVLFLDPEAQRDTHSIG